MWKQHGLFRVTRVARNGTREGGRSQIVEGWVCPSKELGCQSVGDRDPFRGLKQGLTYAFIDHDGRCLENGTILEARRPLRNLGQQTKGNPVSSEHAWNLIGMSWGERCRDAGWRARERGLTRARLAVGDLAKGDKNSSNGPRRSRILQTGPSWLGLGRKQTRWESPAL